MSEEKTLFCIKCGLQLSSIDEIADKICYKCRTTPKEVNDDRAFFCFMCGRKLSSMKEIAQGVCDNCKASIIKKLE